MLKAYQLLKGNQVLLLGEGNFSFCKDFIIFNESLLGEEFSSVVIIATCLENQTGIFSDFKKDNIKFILSKGVTVNYNVDATDLKFNSVINNLKYDKIIFNFPHVGGKMKIHLNRKLLKDFFSSACDVLNENGSIVVALCDGQGGTKADKKLRNWNDSWQITEMAAQSDLILYYIEPFDVKCFSNYVNVGYRSCEKSFHFENSIVYSFRKHHTPRILQEDPNTWMRAEGDIPNVILSALEKYLVNPWSNINSASNYTFLKLIEEISAGASVVGHKSIIKYVFPMAAGDINPCSASMDVQSKLLNIFDLVSSENPGHECIAVKGLMMKDPVPLKEFSHPPVRCQVLIFGLNLNAVLNQCLTNLLKLFDLDCQLSVNKTSDILLSTFTLHKQDCDSKHVENIIESLSLSNGVPCHIIHVDELAQILFEIKDWQSLWNGRVYTSSDKPMFYPTVLLPKEYAFDLGLSVPLKIKDKFENEFYFTLWLLAGDIIDKVEHLTTYEPTDRELICYCYRITYKSYNAPLYRKRVIYFHEKIIAKVVSRVLQVNIT